MRTTDNKKLISEFIATVFNAHDLDALPRFVSNDRLTAAARGLVTGVPDVQITIQHAIAEDDLVAVRLAGQGTHTRLWRGLQPTGKRWEAACNAHYRVASGRIVDFWVMWDWLSIMQQLGA
jgi:predicted ester cyclase